MQSLVFCKVFVFSVTNSEEYVLDVLGPIMYDIWPPGGANSPQQKSKILAELGDICCFVLL